MFSKSRNIVRRKEHSVAWCKPFIGHVTHHILGPAKTAKKIWFAKRLHTARDMKTCTCGTSNCTALF